MKFSIVVPVFNEEGTIREIIGEIKKVSYPGQVEIIIVNDGSSDKSAEIIGKMKGIIFLNFKKNRGKGWSLRQGFKKATGDIVLIQDADLEYNPKDHLKLIEVFKSNKVDVVYGSRFLKGHHDPRYTVFYFGNLFLSFLTRLLYRKEITDMETCYKAFKRNIIKKIKLKEDRFGFEVEITCKLLKRGTEIKEVPISYKSRTYAQGKKIGVKDGLWAIYLLLKYRLEM